MSSLSHWLILHKKQVKNTLFVFAHPDDEVIHGGALLYWMAAHSFTPHVLILTHGENGINRTYTNRSRLTNIRHKEFIAVMKQAHIMHASILHLPDGGLIACQRDTRSIIHTYCHDHHIGAIVTHDPTGGTGHPDHITISWICKQLATANNLHLFYSIDPMIQYNKDIKYTRYELALSKKMVLKKIQLLEMYVSQITKKEISAITLRLLFTPYEYFACIKKGPRVAFKYTRFHPRGYTFVPDTHTRTVHV